MPENKELSNVKSRFCPSPTGLMHLGNARTALFNALLAKGNDGQFLLRIEDTDKERSDERYTDHLKEDLQWLGLQWDEGPDCDRGLGPYSQSKRQSIYDDYYKRLEAMDLAYPCFCSEEELALMRKIQRSQGRPPRYAGTCRDLTPAEVEEKIATGLQPTLRFRVPENETVTFVDLVRGEQTFSTNDIGDFIVRRANGTPPFMYCNAIDDALMEVTYALRGEDHLTNTPRQIMILDALSLPIPTYGHIALIVGPDGSPLSKRHGSKSIKALREEGYLSGAVTNYLARLGHYYGHDDYLSLQELGDQFTFESLSKSPAKFNVDQLNYWQKQAVDRLSNEALWEWLSDAVRVKVPVEAQADFLELIKPNIRFPKDAEAWIQIVFGRDLQYTDEAAKVLDGAGADYFRVAAAAFNEHGLNIDAVTLHIKQILDLKGKALYMPLRVALTGEKHGPELGKIIALMDAHEIHRRMEAAQ